MHSWGSYFVYVPKGLSTSNVNMNKRFFTLIILLVYIFFTACGCSQPLYIVKTWEVRKPVEKSTVDKSEIKFELQCEEITKDGILAVSAVIDPSEDVKVQKWGDQRYNAYNPGVSFISKPIFIPIGIACLGAIFWIPFQSLSEGKLNTKGSWAIDYNENGKYDLIDYLTYLVGWFNPFSASPVDDSSTKTRTILLEEHTETKELTTRKPFDGTDVYCVITSQHKQKAFSTKTGENGKAHVNIGSIIKDFVGDDVTITISDKQQVKESPLHCLKVSAYNGCEIVRHHYGKRVFETLPVYDQQNVNRAYQDKFRSFLINGQKENIIDMGEFAVKHLSALLKDEDANVRSEVVVVLEELKNHGFGQKESNEDEDELLIDPSDERPKPKRTKTTLN